MALGKGYAARAAIGKETSWGSAVTVGQMLPFTSESIEKAITKLASEYLDGSPARRGLTNSAISVQGDLSGEVIFDTTGGTMTFEQLIYAAVMNAGTRDATNGLNKYTPATGDGVQHTIAFEKDVSVWEIPGAKVNTLEISGEADSKIVFTAGIIGKTLLRTGDTGIVNNTAAFDAISYTDPTVLTFKDAVFRIGDQVDALAAGDQVTIDQFTFTINNNLTDPQFASEDASHTDADLTLEPVRNGFREVTLKIRIPRYTSDQLFTWDKNGTALQADLKFTVGSYQFNLLIPHLQINESPKASVGGVEVYPIEVSFQLFKNNSNSFMTFQDGTAITYEFGIEVKSDRTTPAS